MILSRSADQCIYLICDGVAFEGIECCETFTSNWFKKKPSPKTTCKLPPSHFMQAKVIFAGHGIAIVVDFFSTKIRFRPKDPQVHHDLGWLIRDGWTSTIVSANHLAINVPGNFVGEPFKSWAAINQKFCCCDHTSVWKNEYRQSPSFSKEHCWSLHKGDTTPRDSCGKKNTSPLQRLLPEEANGSIRAYHWKQNCKSSVKIR